LRSYFNRICSVIQSRTQRHSEATMETSMVATGGFAILQLLLGVCQGRIKLATTSVAKALQKLGTTLYIRGNSGHLSLSLID
jgi:hypothetical protein